MTLPPSSWRFLHPLSTQGSKIRLVFAGRHFQAALGSVRAHLLSSHPELYKAVDLIHAPSQHDLMREAPTAHVAIPFMEHFDTEFIQAASPNLRLIQQYGVGLERVDIQAATRHGIAVSNVPAAGSGNAESTAEHALMLSMMLLRHVHSDLPRRFENRQLGGLPLPRTLHGKRVTVVGFGSVGSLLCEYLVALGAHVTAIRNREWCPVQDEHVVVAEKVSCITRALPTTDVLILCCQLTNETWHLLDTDMVKLLPRGALVVNVGRGPLVEYNAILTALQDGTIGGFASDVGVGGHASNKPSEPWDPTDELSLHPNTIFTPHVGGYCDESYGPEGKITHAVVQAIESVIQGRPPRVWVNQPAIWNGNNDAGSK